MLTAPLWLHRVATRSFQVIVVTLLGCPSDINEYIDVDESSAAVSWGLAPSFVRCAAKCLRCARNVFCLFFSCTSPSPTCFCLLHVLISCSTPFPPASPNYPTRAASIVHSPCLHRSSHCSSSAMAFRPLQTLPVPRSLLASQNFSTAAQSRFLLAVLCSADSRYVFLLLLLCWAS